MRRIPEGHPVIAWGSAAGEAVILTESYVASAFEAVDGHGAGVLPVASYNVLTLIPDVAGLDPTTLELLIEVSLDGLVYNVLPTQLITAGVVAIGCADPVQLSPTSARWPAAVLDVGVFKFVRISAKRTGGDGTSTLLLTLVAGAGR